jgi:formamidopyrimidine-DNA glycosylase
MRTMPELPEIEVVRRTLEPILVGRTLRVASIGPHDMRARGEGRGSGRGGAWITPKELLDGARIDRLERRGKRLAILAKDGRALVVQLGMSGQLLAVADAGSTHRHACWTFDARMPLLVFRDPRRFGGLTPYERHAAMHAAWEAELGPDGLRLETHELLERLVGSRPVKAALLDQHVVAGVGNIYADESLHLAGIDPRTKCARLGAERVDRLAKAIRTILNRAADHGGSTLRDHRSGHGRAGAAQLLHAVYGRAGKPCLACEAPLRGMRLAGRATVWCPDCQARTTSRRRVASGS